MVKHHEKVGAIGGRGQKRGKEGKRGEKRGKEGKRGEKRGKEGKRRGEGLMGWSTRKYTGVGRVQN